MTKYTRKKNKLNGANPDLIKIVEDLLAMAKEGTLQSLIGTAFTTDRRRLSIFADFHDNPYEMLGSLEVLRIEYVNKHTQMPTMTAPPNADPDLKPASAEAAKRH